MTAVEFADPERGIFGTLRSSGAAVLFDHEVVLGAAAEADADLDAEGGRTTANVELNGNSLRLELAPIGVPLDLRGERLGAVTLRVCQAIGELRRDGQAQPLSGLAVQREVRAAEDAAANSLTRSIAIAFADGGLLAAHAARPAGAEHGDEEVVAAIAEPSGEITEVREPLLSTQYDAAGHHVRASLELWPEADAEPRPPLRASGSIVCGTSLEVGGRRLEVAFFRWAMDGRPGLGGYEVLASPHGD
jgi:hypothetical protein